LPSISAARVQDPVLCSQDSRAGFWLPLIS
jgi:hypothetical protein